MLKKAVQQGRSEQPLNRGGWDDSNCARPTRGVRDRALREQGNYPSYPIPPFSASCQEPYFFSGVGSYFGEGGKAPCPGVAVLPQSGGQTLRL